MEGIATAVVLAVLVELRFKVEDLGKRLHRIEKKTGTESWVFPAIKP